MSQRKFILWNTKKTGYYKFSCLLIFIFELNVVKVYKEMFLWLKSCKHLYSNSWVKDKPYRSLVEKFNKNKNTNSK